MGSQNMSSDNTTGKTDNIADFRVSRQLIVDCSESLIWYIITHVFKTRCQIIH